MGRVVQGYRDTFFEKYQVLPEIPVRDRETHRSLFRGSGWYSTGKRDFPRLTIRVVFIRNLPLDGSEVFYVSTWMLWSSGISRELAVDLISALLG